MNKSILSQLDELAAEMEDMQAVVEKTEKFRKFGKWVSEHRSESDIVCEINRYQDLVSIDAEGTLIKADNLLQLRYIDDCKGKKKEK